MNRYHDIDPMDLDPETGRPYSNYSSPSLDTSFHDAEMAGEEDDYDDSYPPACTNPQGHSWVCRDDNEEISYCEWCGADGNA
jgi:hypothetical protein